MQHLASLDFTAAYVEEPAFLASPKILRFVKSRRRATCAVVLTPHLGLGLCRLGPSAYITFVVHYGHSLPPGTTSHSITSMASTPTLLQGIPASSFPYSWLFGGALGTMLQ